MTNLRMGYIRQDVFSLDGLHILYYVLIVVTTGGILRRDELILIVKVMKGERHNLLFATGFRFSVKTTTCLVEPKTTNWVD